MVKPIAILKLHVVSNNKIYKKKTKKQQNIKNEKNELRKWKRSRKRTWRVSKYD